MTSSADQRRTLRHPCHGTIEIRIDGWRLYPGRILNLGIDGCLVEAAQWAGCEPGDLLDLCFSVNHLSFRTQCIVRWTRPSGTVGVEILLVSVRGRRQLDELIQELAATSADFPFA
jgi:hypothetical protein